MCFWRFEGSWSTWRNPHRYEDSTQKGPGQDTNPGPSHGELQQTFKPPSQTYPLVITCLPRSLIFSQGDILWHSFPCCHPASEHTGKYTMAIATEFRKYAWTCFHGTGKSLPFIVTDEKTQTCAHIHTHTSTHKRSISHKNRVTVYIRTISGLSLCSASYDVCCFLFHISCAVFFPMEEKISPLYQYSVHNGG